MNVNLLLLTIIAVIYIISIIPALILMKYNRKEHMDVDVKGNRLGSVTLFLSVWAITPLFFIWYLFKKN